MIRHLERDMYRKAHGGVKTCFRVFHPDRSCHTWMLGTGDYAGTWFGGYLDTMPDYTRAQYFYEERRGRR